MQIKIIGAGLAGCEAALWLADHGVQVDLYEQKPVKFSPAHKSAGFAELICSNSLKAERPDSASGLLKIEMRMMGSHLLDAAETARVAAGGALAVDRDVFSTAVTEMVEKNSGITVHREEVTALDESVPVLVASGPLTEGALAEQIAALTGDTGLLWSNEVVRNRAAILSSNLERMGVRNTVVSSVYPEMLAEKLGGYFDKVLVDAPCSGLGVIRKKPDIRYKPLDAIERLPEVQRALLPFAGSMARLPRQVPAALAISALETWLHGRGYNIPLVTPLMMLGGAFLCFEGVEKLAHKFLHSKEDDEAQKAARKQAVADANVDLVA